MEIAIAFIILTRAILQHDRWFKRREIMAQENRQKEKRNTQLRLWHPHSSQSARADLRLGAVDGDEAAASAAAADEPPSAALAEADVEDEDEDADAVRGPNDSR
jgi:hypothetical protein